MERRTRIPFDCTGSEENATRRKNSRYVAKKSQEGLKSCGRRKNGTLNGSWTRQAKAIPREYLYSRHLPAVNPWPAIKVGRQTGLVSSSLVCRASSLQPCNSRRSLTWTIIAHGAGYHACVRLSPSCSSLYDACPRGPTR